MSELSEYRASIRRLIEASDTNEAAAFKREGIDGRTAAIVSSSKSFQASRSASKAKLLTPDKPCGGMSHVKALRRMA